MAVRGSKSLIVDFSDLYAYDAELARAVLNDPADYLPKFDAVVMSKLRMRDPEYAEAVGRVHVRFRALPQETPLRRISSDHIGRLTMVNGIIVRATVVMPLLIKAVFRCRSCGELIYLEQGAPYVRTPTECSSCGRRRGFDLDSKESTFIDSQRITVQEMPEELPPGQLPRSLNVFLKDDLVDIARPGDRVTVIGVIDLVQRQGRGGTLRAFDLILEANNVEVSGRELEMLEITPEDEERIKELASDPWIHRKILQSIAPSIYGYEHVKEAIMYLLFGGVTKELPDVRIRGDINVLLVGDPGTGKCVGRNSLIVLEDGTISEIGRMTDSALSERMARRIDDGYYVEVNHRLPSLGPEGLTVTRRASILWKRLSLRRLYEVETRTGRRIIVTPTHPFFTIRGGALTPIKAEELRRGDFVAVARRLKVSGRPQRLNIHIERGKTNARHIGLPEATSPELCRIIGYLLGDGCCYKTSATYNVIFINSSPELRRDFIDCFERVFGVKPRAFPSHRERDLWVSSVEVGRFLEKLTPSLFRGADSKEIPEVITRCSDNEIANLIRAYFDCDATVSGKEREIAITSASEKLLRQIQLLLLRFGIQSQIRIRVVGGKTYFRLRISGEDALRYMEHIGFLHPGKMKRLRESLEAGGDFNPNLDVIPGVNRLIRYIRLKLNLRQSECGVPLPSLRHCERGGRNPSRRSLKKIVNAFTCRLRELMEIRERLRHVENWPGLRRVRLRLRIPQRRIAKALGVSQTLISRYELGKERAPNLRLLKAVKDHLSEACDEMISDPEAIIGLARLKMLSNSDIFWDRITRVEEIESEDRWVYDMQVDEAHNFIANGFFVHNSQILQFAAKVAPRGLYTTGRGSTAAGLTAAVVREGGTGNFVLEAGALVLGDMGVCCIDEIEKMRDEDRSAIHPAMEQQVVSIAKGGIVATLNARTSILAAANPALGRYNPYQTVAENINLPVTILSRFDLIFVLRDQPEEERDVKLAEHILRLHRYARAPVKPPIELELLRKYIGYAKRIKPVITGEVMERFKEFYLKMRAASREGGEVSPISITPRQLESLIRLAEARARVHLREEVTIEDAEAVIALVQYSLQQVGIDLTTGAIDIDVIMTGKPRSLQVRLQRVLSIIAELERETGVVKDEDLYKALEEEYGMNRNEVARLIGILMRDGTIYSPRPGYYKRSI
jgi:replicative DNA helicase Mcm